jgi:hypothetical protein
MRGRINLAPRPRSGSAARYETTPLLAFDEGGAPEFESCDPLGRPLARLMRTVITLHELDS